MACSTMLRNGLYGGSFLSSEFGPGKAAIKVDISRPEQQEQMNNREKARRQGIALGNFRTHLLLHTLQRNIDTITAAKCGQWYRLMQTYIPRCLNSARWKVYLLPLIVRRCNCFSVDVIGHFRITFGLFFKASPGAHLFI